MTTGQKTAAKTLAEHNVQLFQEIGAKTIVTACAGCYRSLKQQYPLKFGLLKTPEDSTKNDQTPHVVHISQYLNQLLTKKSFPISTPIRVTYHYPCHLGRSYGGF